MSAPRVGAGPAIVRYLVYFPKYSPILEGDTDILVDQKKQEDETTLWIAKPDEGQRDTASHLRQFSVVTDA
ncbi:hypothetical protein VPNG_01145 [Cytospora leucostoma]|uniref:Uncharacterized protein n=1 Tax=Cytospora leucostoma TaxID=1230097 RepID=A0A423XL17_9PEZI|nr:hypothetical protein VPNG_01145 [Cytospora leucostoma]